VRSFIHQRQQIVFRVPEEGHPEIGGRHPRDDLGFSFNAHALGEQLTMGGRNVGYVKIKD
jgi:hypothetical protein